MNIITELFLWPFKRLLLPIAEWGLKCGLKLSLTGSIALGFAAVIGGMYIKVTLGVMFAIPCVAF